MFSAGFRWTRGVPKFMKVDTKNKRSQYKYCQKWVQVWEMWISFVKINFKCASRRKNIFVFESTQNLNSNNVFCRKYSLRWNEFLAMNCGQLQLSNMFQNYTKKPCKRDFSRRQKPLKTRFGWFWATFPNIHLPTFFHQCLKKCLKNLPKQPFSRRHSAPQNTFWLVLSYISEHSFANILPSMC